MWEENGTEVCTFSKKIVFTSGLWCAGQVNNQLLKTLPATCWKRSEFINVYSCVYREQDGIFLQNQAPGVLPVNNGAQPPLPFRKLSNPQASGPLSGRFMALCCS